MTQLVYIGGYGRSGSTLLERLLTANPNVVACGEVGRHLRRLKGNKTCSCGRKMKFCPVWTPFRKSKILKRWDHRHLTLAMLDHVSCNFSVMVDSSKTAWGSVLMPFRFHRDLGGDFLLVHLVRDPRGVCWSTIRTLRRRKSGGRELTRCLQTFFGWTFANLACEAFGLVHPSQYVRLHYEDLVDAPQDTLAPIFARPALESSNLGDLAKHDNCHQLHGNRMRFKSLALKDLKEDLAWRTKMPRSYRCLILLLGWPLSIRYGYLRNSRAVT